MRIPLHALLVIVALAVAGCASTEESADPGADDAVGDGTTNSDAPPAVGQPTSDAPTEGEGNATGAEEKAPAEPASVAARNIAFEPAELTVTTGSTVKWTNHDGVAHTVTADDGAFDSGALLEGETFSQTFDSPGTFAYHCEIHPSMMGTVTVE